MQIIFNKYHGTGNDFIIIDNRGNSIKADNYELINGLCNRHTGIGADGLILIYDHPEYDFEMKYYNADGRESSMCGNGGRCAVAFAQRTGIKTKTGTFLAIDGAHKYKVTGDKIAISLRNARPPVDIGGNNFIDTGSPHYIINVPDCRNVDVIEKGRTIRWSERFAPSGTNVNFIENRPDGIFVRTYERGVENETLSCGTGVTASAISSKWGKGPGNYIVNVMTPGGELSVSFEITYEIIKNICLSGPAQYVFAGVLDI